MQHPIHILTQLGILTSFSIAKKISENEIDTFFKKHKKLGKSEDEIGEMLKTKVFGDIEKAVINNQIPGVISPLGIVNSNSNTSGKKFSDLNKYIMIIVEKLILKKYDKFSLCYIINTLVNLLGLTEKDFEQFHKKISQQIDDGDDYTEDGDDELSA